MVRPCRSLRGALALCALLLVALTGAPAAANAAAPGTVSGRIDGPIPTTGRGEASVRAYAVGTGGLAGADAADRSGRFRLRLPAGVYLLHAVSIRDGGVVREQRIGVSLRAGQRRTGVVLRVKLAAVRPTATAQTPASAVGASAPTGMLTYRLDDVTGPTRALATLGRGLPSLIAADLTGNETCTATQLAGTRERTILTSAAKLRRSPYVTKGTPIRPAPLAPQLAVVGALSAGTDRARAAFTLRIVDLATGATVDTLTGSVRRSGRGLFTDQRRLAAALTERICRRPRSYSVRLAIDARGDYTAYNSTARLVSTAVAKTRTAAPYTAWAGGAPFTWADSVFRSRVTLCKVTKVTPGAGNWSTTVTAVPGAQVKVDLELTASEYTAYSKADFACEPGLASATGAPGPLLTGTAPRSFTLPATGGTGTIASTTTLPTGGFIQNGTVTLVPLWGHALPGA